MSFSSEVKEELKTKTDTAKHCQIAVFAAKEITKPFVLQP